MELQTKQRSIVRESWELSNVWSIKLSECLALMDQSIVKQQTVYKQSVKFEQMRTDSSENMNYG